MSITGLPGSLCPVAHQQDLHSSLSEVGAQVSSLLESLPNLFAQTQLADACAGAAAQACIDTLKVRLGQHLLYSMISAVSGAF